jgi:hypothetical protein
MFGLETLFTVSFAGGSTDLPAFYEKMAERLVSIFK